MKKCKRGHQLRYRASSDHCPKCSLIDADERFWSKVEMAEGHGLWTGGKNKAGYGLFYLSDRTYVRAHIFAWESKHGPVPDGKELGHTCEFRHCVIHVRPITHHQNVLEGRLANDPELHRQISETKRRKKEART